MSLTSSKHSSPSDLDSIPLQAINNSRHDEGQGMPSSPPDHGEAGMSQMGKHSNGLSAPMNGHNSSAPKQHTMIPHEESGAAYMVEEEGEEDVITAVLPEAAQGILTPYLITSSILAGCSGLLFGWDTGLAVSRFHHSMMGLASGQRLTVFFLLIWPSALLRRLVCWYQSIQT